MFRATLFTLNLRLLLNGYDTLDARSNQARQMYDRCSWLLAGH